MKFHHDSVQNGVVAEKDFVVLAVTGTQVESFILIR
jgi:hypothetical protein